MRPLLWTLFSAAAFTSGGVQAALMYRVERIPEVPFTSEAPVTPADINNHGVVVGSFVESPFVLTFTYRNGVHEVLANRGYVTVPGGINDQGQVAIAGEYYRNDYIQPWLYSGGQFKNLIPGYAGEYIETSGDVGGINKSGHVVGNVGRQLFFYDGVESRYLDPGIGSYDSIQAFGINDADAFIFNVKYTDRPDTVSFKYENGQAEILNGLSSVRAINNANQILGIANNTYVIQNADGATTALDFSAAADLNDRGWAVGQTFVDGSLHAFVYRNGRSHDLNALLSADDSGQWLLERAGGLNDKGQIVGTGLFNGQQSGFIATPVPEPGTWALMCCGFGLVIAGARRRTAAFTLRQAHFHPGTFSRPSGASGAWRA